MIMHVRVGDLPCTPGAMQMHCLCPVTCCSPLELVKSGVEDFKACSSLTRQCAGDETP